MDQSCKSLHGWTIDDLRAFRSLHLLAPRLISSQTVYHPATPRRAPFARMRSVQGTKIAMSQSDSQSQAQPEAGGEKYNLTIAAIFKNENPYIREWLEFHILVGFDHFYLYDNDGGLEAKRILKPFIEQGHVTLHPWLHLDGGKYDRATPFGGRDKNHAAFGHAAKTYRDDFRWIMKIDIDEFLIPMEGDSIPDLLERYDSSRIASIRIPRINFGDCGHVEQPEGLVGEIYTRREPVYSNHKDMGNSHFLNSNDHFNSAHSWGLKRLMFGKVIRERTVHEMRVNHYYTKSLAEWLTRQNTYGSRPASEAGFSEKNSKSNDVLDESMLRFIPRIKEALRNR
jgi:hypothetical protein